MRIDPPAGGLRIENFLMTSEPLFKKTIVFFILLVIGFGIYANSFNNELFWDDNDVIVNNEYIKDWQHLPQFFTECLIAGAGQASNYYRPLLLVTFSVDYHIWGLNPVGYHITNTLFHIVVAFLVFLFIFRLQQLARGGGSSGGVEENKEGKGFIECNKSYILPFVVSLIFLIHPLQTEAVTYVAGRGDPLSSIFSLLAILFYIDHRTGRSQSGHYAAAILFFILGLLVKEQVIFLPALILLVELVLFAGRGRDRRPETGKENIKFRFTSIVKNITPWAVISIIYFILRLTILNFEDLLDGFDHDPLYDNHPWFRVLTFGRVMINYFRLLFAPLELHMAWEVPIITSVFNVYVLGFLGIAAVIAFVCIKTWKYDRLITFGFAWFFIILAPRTNIIKMNRPMYEHWLYLPLVGFFLALFCLAILGYKYIENRNKEFSRYLMYVSLVILVVYLGWLAVRTVDRNNDWQDPITFYTKNLQYTPNSYIQHNNLGMIYAEKGEYQKAIEHYKKSRQLQEKYPQVYYNLGNSYRELGRTDEAVKQYKKAIRVAPRFYFPYNNLLNIYASRGEKRKAFSLLEEMDDIFDNDQYLYTRGVVFYRFGEYGRAIDSWKRLLDKDPNNMKVKMLIYEAEKRK